MTRVSEGGSKLGVRGSRIAPGRTFAEATWPFLRAMAHGDRVSRLDHKNTPMRGRRCGVFGARHSVVGTRRRRVEAPTSAPQFAITSTRSRSRVSTTGVALGDDGVVAQVASAP